MHELAAVEGDGPHTAHAQTTSSSSATGTTWFSKTINSIKDATAKVTTVGGSSGGGGDTDGCGEPDLGTTTG